MCAFVWCVLLPPKVNSPRVSFWTKQNPSGILDVFPWGVPSEKKNPRPGGKPTTYDMFTRWGPGCGVSLPPSAAVDPLHSNLVGGV